MNTVCTIVTKSHIPWALALCSSVQKFDKEVEFNILVSDANFVDKSNLDLVDKVKFIYLSDVANIDNAKEITTKYKNQQDYLRWSLKPILIEYLLNNGFSKVMFCDCDIYFYNDISFIWEELNSSNIIITPHWFDCDSPTDIQTLHTTGICNGGFFCASTKGLMAVKWWSKMCYNYCSNKYGGINVDQGYLEFLPFFFDGIKILEHKGCNVSYWSNRSLKRIKEGDSFYVEDRNLKRYPLIFYHFASNRFSQFFGVEQEFYPIIEELQKSLQNFGYKKDIIQMGKLQTSNNHISFYQKVINRIKASIPYRIYKITK